MAYTDDVLNPDPAGDPNERESGGGFGLRLFKSSNDARRNDVQPRVDAARQGPRSIADVMGGGGFAPDLSAPAKPSAPAKAGSGKTIADLMGMGTETYADEEEQAPEQGNFSRGLSVSGKQLKQTAYGTAALIGDTLGSDTVKEWGLKGYKKAEEEVQAISKETDSFTTALEKGGLGKWFTYSAGYLLGQAGELGAASIAGGLLGSAAAPGAGTAAGAVAGALEKGAVESGIKAAVGKLIDKEAEAIIKAGAGKITAEMAAEQAAKSVYRTIGATTANTFLNATQELGSIYGDAVEEAAKTGKEYSLGKIWLSGVMATAIDSWADSKAVGKLMDSVKGGNGVGGIAMEAFKGGFREGMTEGVQTAIERWGADKDLASKEAFREYIDSAAVGVLGGSVSGGSAAGVKRMLEPSEPTPTPGELKTTETKGIPGAGEPTNLPEHLSGKGANELSQFPMPRAQFMDTLQDSGYVAAMYSIASPDQQRMIKASMERAGLINEFNEAATNSELIRTGQQKITENPELTPIFLASVEQFGGTLPRGGVYKPAPVKPQTEEERQAEIAKQNEAEFGAVDVQPVTQVTPPTVQEISTPKDVLTAVDSGFAVNPDQLRTVAKEAGIEVTPESKPEDLIAGIRQSLEPKPKEEAPVIVEPIAPTEAKAQEVSQPEEIEGTDEEILSKVLSAKSKRELKPEDITIVQLPKGIQDIASMFGVNLVGFRANGGVTIKGMSHTKSNKVYINAGIQGKVDMRFVLGHEVWHQLENRDPKMAALLADEVVAYIQENQRDEYTKKLAELGYKPEDVTSEMAGDVLGVLFTEESFWQQVGKKNPSLLQRVMQVIDGILAEIADRIGKNKLDFGRAKDLKRSIKDLETVRDLMASIVADMAEKPQAAQEPASTDVKLMDDSDAVESVKELIRQDKVPAAAKLFSEQKIWEKSGKKLAFNQLIKDSRAEPTPVAQPAEATPAKEGDITSREENPNARSIEEYILETQKPVRPVPITDELDSDFGAARQTSKDIAPSQLDALNAKLPRAAQSFIAAQPPGARRRMQIALAERTDEQLQSLGDFLMKYRSTDTNSPIVGYLKGLRSTKLVDAVLALSAMTPDRVAGFEEYLNKPTKQQPKQLALNLQHDPDYNVVKGKVDAVLMMTGDAAEYRSTLAKMWRSVERIDEALRKGTNFTAEGKQFEVTEKGDENAYLWSDEQGFGTAKNLPQEKLLAARRSIMDDIQQIRTETQKGLASLFYRNLDRMEYELSQVRTQSLKDGIPMDTVDAAYEPARRMLISLMNRKREKLVPTPAEQTAMDTAFQTDMFQAERDEMEQYHAAYGLVSDLASKKISKGTFHELMSQGMREGDFTHTQMVQAMRAFGLDPSHDLINLGSQIAWRKSLGDFMGESKYTEAARVEWLTSMHKIVSSLPKTLDGNNFSEAEKIAYRAFIKPRKEFKAAYKVTEDTINEADPRKAFPGMLWAKYGLAEMRDTNLIYDKNERSAVQAMYAEPVETWFSQVAYALSRRPSIEGALFDPEEGLLPTDIEAFKKWVEQKKRANAREAEVMAKAPHFMEIRNIDGLEPDLESTPGVEGETRKAPTEYERSYVQIANAELNSLDDVQASIQRLIAIRQGRFDPETGEVLTDDEVEAEIATTVSQIMHFASERNKSDEDFAKEERKSGSDGEPKELSFDQPGMIEENLGEENPTEEDAAASDEDEVSALAGVPKSLEKGNQYKFSIDDEYSFQQGPWKGMPAMAALADELGKLDLPVRTVLLEHAGQLKEPLRTAVMKRLGQNLGAKGVYHDGTVYLFGSQLAGPSDLKFTVFQEIYGHLGLRAFLGEKFDSFLEKAYANSKDVRFLADEIMKHKGVGKLEAVDEALAGMAATDAASDPFRNWIGKVIEGLRTKGFDVVAEWLSVATGADIAFTLQQAKESVRNNKLPLNAAPEEFRVAEQVLPYEMFAVTKGRTRAYVRFNPVTDTWAVFIARGNDIRDKSGYDSFSVERYEDAYEIIKKMGVIQKRTRSGLYIDDKIAPDLIKIPDFKNVSGWESFKRGFITRVQNEYHPVFQVVEALRRKGRINPDIDVKDALMLYERRAGAAVEWFRENRVDPLLKLISEAGKLGANMDVINRYLAARHADERNKAVAKFNKEMPDGGSGLMTTPEGIAKRPDLNAFQIISDAENAVYGQLLKEIGRYTDMVSREKLDYMYKHGLITRKAFEAMSQYEHYVNLSGVAGVEEEYGEDDDPGRLAGGNKFNAQKGTERRAFGRGEGNEAPDVLARTILSAEAQIIRSQKNLVAQRILAMFEVNYDPNFIQINKQAFRRQTNGVTGEAEFVPDSTYIRDKKVMVAKVRGIPITMEFADNSAGSFADAVHGMVMPPQATPIMSQLGKVNQFMGQMLTTWNPAWIAINFMRDIQTLYFNAATDGRITKQQARQMLKTIPKAIATALYRFNPSLPIKPDPEMLRIYDEMKREGGLTSFVNRQGLESQVEQIDMALNGKSRMQRVQGLFAFMEHLTIPMEVAPRLAAYKVVRDGGMSAVESAVFSGEITINFNMRGSMKELRQLYLFFNPAVQGTAKMFDLAKKNPKKMTQYAFAFAAVGAMANLIGRAFSDDDEDGINRMDKLPVYKRATSIVLSADGVAIPIPYGWNAFYAAGHFAMDTLLGEQPLSVSAKRVAISAFEAFSPLGSAGLDSKDAVTAVAKAVTPTAGLPIVEYIANENRYGAPIRQEQSPFDPAVKPDSESYFRSVSPISKAVTSFLNENTEGNKYHAGKIDVNPATIDFMIASYLPGLINEAYKGAGLAIRAARGEDLKDAPLPIVGRFEAKVSDSWDPTAFRRASQLVETTYKEFKMLPESRERISEEYPSIGAAHAIISSTNQQVREIRQNATRVERSESYYDGERVERLNELRKRETAAYQRAVKRLSELGGKYRESLVEAQ